MSVNDHGLEVLKKAAIEVDGSDPLTEYRLRTSGTGTFSPTGLNTAIKITTMDIGDTETLLPISALDGRNSFLIRNFDTVETLYVGPTGLTADNVIGTTSGWDVPKNSYLPMDVTNNVPLYGIAPTGKTIRVKIMELA